MWTTSDVRKNYGRVSNFDTYMWHHIRTSTIGEDRIFPIGQKENGMIQFKFENATYTIFNQPKSSVASSSSWRQMVVRLTNFSQPQVREFAVRSQRNNKQRLQKEMWFPKELLKVYELRTCRKYPSQMRNLLSTLSVASQDQDTWGSSWKRCLCDSGGSLNSHSC